MADRNLGSARGRTKVLLFLAAFCQAVGGLALLASGGSDYWLLAWPSCGGGAQRPAPPPWLHRRDPGHLTPGNTQSQVGLAGLKVLILAYSKALTLPGFGVLFPV